MLDDILSRPETSKLVVFCHFRYQVEQVCKALRESNVRHETMTGDQKSDQKKNAVFSFQEGDARVLVANIQVRSFSHLGWGLGRWPPPDGRGPCSRAHPKRKSLTKTGTPPLDPSQGMSWGCLGIAWGCLGCLGMPGIPGDAWGDAWGCLGGVEGRSPRFDETFAGGKGPERD